MNLAIELSFVLALCSVSLYFAVEAWSLRGETEKVRMQNLEWVALISEIREDVKMAAFDQVCRCLREDDELAWGYHCQMAVAAMEMGVDRATANQIAMRSMRFLFDVDMGANVCYIATQRRDSDDG